MKKKLLTLMIIVLMFAVLTVPAYASCDDCIGSTEGYDWSEHCEVRCTCEWGPCGSCNDSGTYLETFCGATHQYTYISTNGSHAAICACDNTFSEECTFVYKSTTPSTCQTEGYEVHECSVCKGIKTVMLPIGDHSYSVEPNRVYAPTCTTNGYTEWICETCDHVEQTDIAAPLGHKWIETIIPAECDVAGEHYKVCDTCLLDESEVIPAPGHAWSDEPISCDSTCFTAGTATYVCDTCGTDEVRPAGEIDHNFVNGKCTMCGLSETATESTTKPSGEENPSGGVPGGDSGNDIFEDLTRESNADIRRFLRLLTALSILALLVALLKRKEK